MMELKPGGTKGGEGLFLAGLVLSLGGLWFLFDSIRVVNGMQGVISGALHRIGNHGGGAPGLAGQTTSMGVILVPLFLGIVALFFDAKRTWAWLLMWVGVAILVVEVVSRFRIEYALKGSHALLILGLVGAGVGLMLKSYRTSSK